METLEQKERRKINRRSGEDRRKDERRDTNSLDERWKGESDRRKLFGRRVRHRRSGVDRRTGYHGELFRWEPTPSGWSGS
jgi:hypothetical protein